MRTEKQILASRANGAKSRGPVTPAGKAISSQNALKHGILASAVLITGESREGFLELCISLFDEFQPATPFEESLIERMAVARWHQERIWEILRTTTDVEIERQTEMGACPHDGYREKAASAFKSLSEDSRSLELMLRYETHYECQYLRAHKRFVECRNARLRNVAAPGSRTEPRTNSAPSALAPQPVEPGPVPQPVETAKRTQGPPPNGALNTPPAPPELPDARSLTLIHGPNRPLVVDPTRKYR